LKTDPISRQTHFLLRRVNKTVRQHQLIDQGDRIAVAVSGGKDSLTLLRLLLARQAVQPERIELVAVHVSGPDVTGGSEQAEALCSHFRELGVEYVVEPLQLAEGESWPLPCYRCAWNRRKALFLAAHRLGCNKMALGHHADDAAQTTLLNLFHHGRLESIPVSKPFFDGLVTVIRPLIDVEEKDIVRFARQAGYPIGQLDCPHAEVSQRAEMAQLLRQIEKGAPWAKSKLQRAVLKYGEKNGSEEESR